MERIVCTCGNPIGAYMQTFVDKRKAKVAKVLEKTTVHVDYLTHIKEFDVDVADIFKELEIELLCCRVFLLGATQQYLLHEL